MTKKLFEKWASVFLVLIISASAFAQKGYEPIRGMGVEAKPVNNSGICLACYSGSMNPVVDANLDNSVSMGNFASLLSGNGISVKNTNTTYPAGYITGFNVDLGTSFITVDLLSSLRISTYKNGVLQETTTSSTLLSVPAFGGSKNRIFLHLKTTKEFNEVRLYQTNVLSLFSAMNVYYAFAFDPAKVPVDQNNICDDIIAGSGVDGNVSGSSSFIAPLSFVQNRERIGDGDKNSYGSIVLPAGLLGSYSVGVLDKNQVYPAGNKAGFVISPDDEGKLISAEFLKNITVETYLYGQLQDSRTLLDGGGLINIKVLGFGSGKQKVTLTSSKPFNEVRLKVTQTLGINLGSLKVYYAFEEPASCDCNDKIQTSGSAIAGNLVTGTNWTSGPGFLGLILAKMTNPSAIVDTNTSNYATATIPAASFLSIFSSYATVDTNTMLPANTYAGFTLEKAANLIGVSVLENIRVTLYNNNTQTDVFTSTGSLISGNFFTTDSNKFYVGGKATKPFNRIKITFYSGTGIRIPQNYYIYNAFASRDDDNDGIPNCFDQCSNGNDSIDMNGNGIPDCAEGCTAVNDKSPSLDTDADGIKDACDLDSDNDGIPDALEDLDQNGKFEDDDTEGVFGPVQVLGDGISSYLDLDSDNDGILDLFESGIPASVISQIDTDRNGIIDSNVAVGNNGIADILETSPDSGILKYPLKNTDGDDKPDFIDLNSNGADYDLYAIGKDNLDDFGAGFISRINDLDKDGIQAVVDTDLVRRGAPNSPLSPYISLLKIGQASAKAITDSDITEKANDIKVYPNPVKSGENLNVKSEETGIYSVFSAQGQLIRSDKFSGNTEISTASLPAGVYIVKIETRTTVKSYKIVVK
ncbi:T9SS type A sorting domain-containing protein [Chryseobacterium carnipullorum]|uniref:T9SS type A sorting domain-containing protein n=1 Tax=Chryseobacterium carnipullorum TaxID=1124835 RepID=UPI0009203D63|nr:T9SS type A sorting domain-containing protein [Chryseobacterium carnipullorum]SHL53825.1 Por secretion system C-terminal sorting domain-containing protein [Chryseobacterium carnipullorum]HBV16408.1 T9SS C-terminal target domain-containing protein [Chryseobacterium carnipullorum]